MFPAFSSFAARPFASIVQVYGILNPRTIFCSCNPKDDCMGGCCSEKTGTGTGTGSINSSIDISFVQFAIKSILNVSTLTEVELLKIIEQLVQKQLTYANYTNILSTVDVTTILNDPYFFFIFYSYTITDYQYVQLQLKLNYANLQQRYIDLIKEKNPIGYGITAITDVGVNVNTQIRLEYLYYMQFYGLPKDGLFLPSILERIKYGIINSTNYHFFTPSNEMVTQYITEVTKQTSVDINIHNNGDNTINISASLNTTTSTDPTVALTQNMITLASFNNNEITIVIM